MQAQYIKTIHAVVDAVNSHRPFRALVETRNQLDERRFAAAGEPHECYLFPGGDVQIDALEDQAIFRIAKANVVEVNIAAQLLWSIVGSSTVQHLRRLIQYLLDALSA